MVSFSRGGFVGLVAAGFVLWLLRPKKVQTLVVVLLLAGVVLLFGNEAYWHEMSTITDTTESTAQGRLDAWKAAWDMFKDNPLGVGGGNFPIRFHEYQPPDSGKIKWGTVAHSLWMTLLSETGVVGVVLYGLLLYTNVRDLVWVTRRAHGDDEASRYIHAIALALLAGLAGYFASGTFLSVLYYPHYFYLTAVIVALRRVAEAEGGQPTSESPSGGDPDRAR
jgi:O-antigen ligase